MLRRIFKYLTTKRDTTEEQAAPVQAAVDPLKDFSDDEIRKAAWEYVSGTPTGANSFWGGTVKGNDAAQKEIDARREKYKDFEPKRMRDAINGWLDYFQRRLDENKADVATQKTRRGMDEFKRKQQEEQKRKRAILDTLKRK